MNNDARINDIREFFAKFGFKEFAVQFYANTLRCEFTQEDWEKAITIHKDEIANHLKRQGFGIFSVRQCPK